MNFPSCLSRKKGALLIRVVWLLIRNQWSWTGLSQMFPQKLTIGSKSLNENINMRSKLTIKTSEQGQWRRSGVFFVNFEHIKLTIQEFFIVSFKTIVCLDQSFLLNVSKTNYLCTPEPRFRWASQLGCDLPTRDRGHTTTGGRWEQPSSWMTNT